MKPMWLGLLTIAMAPGVAHAQAIYPIDRATILSGARFDFKVELPAVMPQDAVRVTINGEGADKVLGAPLAYVEKEDGGEASSLILRNGAISQPGTYTVEVTAGDKAKKVTWTVYGTPARKQASRTTKWTPPASNE